MSALVLLFWPYGALGWANRVTLGRGVLVALVAGALVGGAFQQAIGLWLGVAVIALLLDGVDGWIARRTHSHSPFGARFDMELDALLILLLCLALMRAEALGPWVLLIGAMRYRFVAAGWLLPWLEAPLYDSFRRKLICVWQVTALLLALTPFTSPLYASLLAWEPAQPGLLLWGRRMVAVSTASASLMLMTNSARLTIGFIEYRSTLDRKIEAGGTAPVPSMLHRPK